MKPLASLALALILFAPAMPHCKEQQLQKVASKAESIVIAEVVEVKSSPGFWSSHIASVQYVEYRVLKTLRGPLISHYISVGHYLVKNSLVADKEQIRLSPELFKQGNKLILFLCRDPEKRYSTCDENCGAVLADNSNLDTIRKLVR